MSEKPMPVEQHPKRAGVHRGDEVYYDHPRGARSGTVLAHGEHGCTIQCGKQRHKVKWDRILGHKKRSEQHYAVVEDGEDGMVVADKAGRRRFIGTVPDQTPERVIVKSFVAVKK